MIAVGKRRIKRKVLEREVAWFLSDNTVGKMKDIIDKGKSSQAVQ